MLLAAAARVEMCQLKRMYSSKRNVPNRPNVSNFGHMVFMNVSAIKNEVIFGEIFPVKMFLVSEEKETQPKEEGLLYHKRQFLRPEEAICTCNRPISSIYKFSRASLRHIKDASQTKKIGK